jgi:hypothetical protein
MFKIGNISQELADLSAVMRNVNVSTVVRHCILSWARIMQYIFSDIPIYV